LGKNPIGISIFFTIYLKYQKSKIKILNVEQPTATQHVFKRKVVFLPKNQLGIGQSWRKLVQICQNWILELYLVKFTRKLKFFQLWSWNCPNSSVGSMLDIFHLNMARPDQTREGAGSIPP
jgi:hypothetical protein